ncbi:oligosaccharide flippase family protein [Bacillus marinisedimentorum]|uniref:oligosaccharide flippase family protein n=1 Tax=Bacillus marinisedimentorum TaxID=1821260 RepID=UPI0007E155D9|nr:oligosaccharide flippase family protein [Bacillus marinisedimentorum]
MKSSDRDNNKFQRKALLLSVGNAINAIVAIISLMVITRYLSVNDYATYKQTFLAFNFILPILSLGLTEGLYYFLPTEKKRFSGRVMDCFVIYLFIGLIFSFFILFGGNEFIAQRFNNNEVADLMLWLIPYSLVVLLINCSSVIFNIQNRMRVFIVANLITGLFITLTLILVVILMPTAESAVVVVSLTKFVQGLIFIYLTIKVLPNDDWKPKISTIKQILYFSFPVGLTNMMGTITSQMDGLFVSVMTSPEIYAVYSIGAVEVPIIGIILGSISAAMIPEIRKLIEERHLDESSKLFILATKKVASITLPIMCFLLLWSKEFIEVMYSNEYLDSAPIFQVYLLYFLIRISFTGPVFVSLGLNKFLLLKTLISLLLNVVLTYIFISHIGAIGAAIGTILSSIIVTAFLVFPKLSKEFSVPAWQLYPFKSVVKLIFIGLLSATTVRISVDYIFVRTSAIVLLIISIIIYMFMYLLISYKFNNSEYKWFFKNIKSGYQKMKIKS